MVERANRLRRRAGALFVTSAFNGLARLGRLHPKANPDRHGVEVIRDVPYRATGSPAHTLDVYRPARARDAREPLPALLYVHGGGFRILSKDTHWMMALAFARRGFVVFNVNYRLAPRHPFPAAIEDACAAMVWLGDNAERFGADAGRLVLAGESAGANLVTALAVASSYQRPEAYARAVWDSGLRPLAVMPACGLLQVSDWQRFARRKKISPFILDRIDEVASAYLEGCDGCTDMADPLLVLEREAPGRPLPPFFAICGTKDPILHDTRRLGEALDRHGVDNEIRIYPGEIHAFHAMVWRPQAVSAWRAKFAFLERVLAT